MLKLSTINEFEFYSPQVFLNKLVILSRFTWKMFQDKPRCEGTPQPCVFPFVSQGRTYMGCADSSSLSSQESNGKQSYYKWCAIAVDPQTREVIPGMWGECGAMPSCQPPRGEKQPLNVDGSYQNCRL